MILFGEIFGIFPFFLFLSDDRYYLCHFYKIKNRESADKQFELDYAVGDVICSRIGYLSSIAKFSGGFIFSRASDRARFSVKALTFGWRFLNFGARSLS